MDSTSGPTGVEDGDLAVDDRFGSGTGADVHGLDDVPEPVQPGFWMTVLGCFFAVLAPLIGFLGGSASGAGYDQTGRRLAIWLTIGLVIGGLGVLSAFVGALRWWRATHR